MSSEFPFFRTAKVVGVHRESHCVDIVMMDGNRNNDVPVLTGFGGSNFGTVGLVAPTVDDKSPGAKTYPGEDGAGRDIYCVVGQGAGSSIGSKGMFVLGFLYPMVSEMQFDHTHPDMMVVRHPSDVQVTIEQDGKVSVQHPAGARITIGTDYGKVDLEGDDYDGHYKLRKNLGIKVGIQIKDTAESVITLDHEGNIDLNAPKNITAEAGVDIKATAGRDITADAKRDIKVTAGRDITAQAGGDITAKADGNIDAEATGTMMLKGQMIYIN